MRKSTPIGLGIAASITVLATGLAISAQDKYAVEVPGGLAFAEFRGYEDWPAVAMSEDQGVFAVILGNPIAIAAFREGVPGNGKPFPDGAVLVKIHYQPKKQETYPGQPMVPGTHLNTHFMVKDSKRFADSAGWGWAAFEYDAASDTWRPRNESETPPQGHDAKCGFACHSIVKTKDYVFTEYGHK